MRYIFILFSIFSFSQQVKYVDFLTCTASLYPNFEEKSISGEFSETFACGTAAVITPIREVKSKTGSWLINQGEIGPVALQLRNYLLDLQHGDISDPHGWLHFIH